MRDLVSIARERCQSCSVLLLLLSISDVLSCFSIRRDFVLRLSLSFTRFLLRRNLEF